MMSLAKPWLPTNSAALAPGPDCNFLAVATSDLRAGMWVP